MLEKITRYRVLISCSKETSAQLSFRLELKVKCNNKMNKNILEPLKRASMVYLCIVRFSHGIIPDLIIHYRSTRYEMTRMIKHDR